MPRDRRGAALAVLRVESLGHLLLIGGVLSAERGGRLLVLRCRSAFHLPLPSGRREPIQSWRSTLRAHPSVDLDNLAGHVAGIVGGQKCDH